MKNLLPLLVLLLLSSCNHKSTTNSEESMQKDSIDLAQEVIDETMRSWNSYKKYAWGHDVLKPLSNTYADWYEKPLYISPIDAYSTLHLMGLSDETKEIENYVIDSLNFDVDIYAKIFEVNIRILGGLLSMYHLSGEEEILAKAQDFGDRMLPAFNTPTGIPKFYVNLKTEETKGDTVNIAEAASYTFEMGVLSYFTKDPKYYQAAKKATMAVFERKSDIGLIGDVIDVETGEWVSKQSHICAGVDSYYEYLYKSYLLFGDNDLKGIWDFSIERINRYIAEDYNDKLWYGRVNMETGVKESSVITLYDAFFPAILAISGDMERAQKLHDTWDYVWNKFGLEPTLFDYKKDTSHYPVYDLNPEIIESAYYLYHFTNDNKYLLRNVNYWSDIKMYCKNDLAFNSIENVVNKEMKDYMPTYLFAETLKYLYLTFSYCTGEFKFDEYIFTTEAHQFKRASFIKEEASVNLNIKNYYGR